MPSLEIPSFIFIYRVERCQVTLDLLLILLFLFLLSSNEIFFFFLFFLVDPPRVCRETEGDIQRNTRFCTSTKKALFFFRRDTFEKRVHKHLPGERNPVSSMRRRLYAQQRSIVIRGRSF